MKIGIGYTTRNRSRILEYTLSMLDRFLPENAKVVVVDDASTEANINKYLCSKYKYIEYKHNEKRLGVSHSKNVAFRALIDCDCQFWFDDDTYPFCKNWHVPFVKAMESGQKHLLYLKEWAHVKKVRTIAGVEEYASATGCLLVFHKSIYKDVAGFNRGFPVMGQWHFPLTSKMHNMGHTPLGPYLTIKDAPNYIRCLDMDKPTEDFLRVAEWTGSTLTKEDRARNRKDFGQAKKAANEFLRYRIGKLPPEVEKQHLNNYAMSEECLYWLLENIPEGSTIVELGSGAGTIELCRFYKVISVENDKRWMLAKDATFVHAPLKDYGNYIWFDHRKIVLPDEYQLLIVDAPTKKAGGRHGFLQHLDLFRDDVPVIFDDTHRGAPARLAEEYAKIKNKSLRLFIGHEKRFSVAGA